MADPATPDTPEEKNKGGRPLKFKSVEELDQAVSAYFDMCDPHTEQRVVEAGVNERGDTIFNKRAVLTEQQPYTVSGLARALGISRQTLLDYSKRDEFLDTIEAARERCHEFAEKQLYGRANSGAAFSLKNNWGWRDRQEIDHTSKDQAIPLLHGLAPAGPLVIEDDEDGGTASADDSSDEDQQS